MIHAQRFFGRVSLVFGIIGFFFLVYGFASIYFRFQSVVPESVAVVWMFSIPVLMLSLPLYGFFCSLVWRRTKMTAGQPRILPLFFAIACGLFFVAMCGVIVWGALYPIFSDICGLSPSASCTGS